MATLATKTRQNVRYSLATKVQTSTELCDAFDAVGSTTTTLSGPCFRALSVCLADRRAADKVQALLLTANGGTVNGRIARQFESAFPRETAWRDLLKRLNNDVAYI